MHVGEISFCDKIAYNIKSDETKKFILDRLEKLYEIKIIQKHFDKYDIEKSPKVVNANPHMMCLRSNGNPYFLYLVKYNLIQYCIFIDKKIQQGYYLPRMIIVPLRFNDILFNDTLFEGEMVKGRDNKWYYIINDMLVSNGTKLHDYNLPRRLTMLYDVLQKHYHHDEYDVFRICVKTYFKYNEVDKMMNEHMQHLPYTCRGVYFYPLYLRFRCILCNFNDDLVKKVERVKYKNVKQFILSKDDLVQSQTVSSPQEESDATSESSFVSTSDASSNNNVNVNNKNTSLVGNIEKKVFYVRKTSSPDVYELFDDRNQNVGIACVPSLKISKMMREVTKNMNMVDKTAMNFEWSEKFKKWMPICS